MRTYILVKVIPGKEGRVSEDLEDFFYPYDQSVKVHKTPYHGLIILESRLDSRKVLKLLEESKVGYLREFLALESLVSVSNWRKVVEIISVKVPKGSEISLKVKVRGGSQKLKELMNIICSEIVKRGYVVRKNAKFVIRLETLGNFIGIVVENT